ncbi:MAG: hypothetical protein ACUVX9_07890 [Anaerolineae bacterium]
MSRQNPSHSSQQTAADQQRVLEEVCEQVESDGGALEEVERGVGRGWTAEPTRRELVALLTALAEALSQREVLRYALDGQFVLLPSTGHATVQYEELENARKVLTVRYSWDGP